jgi:hypothetical protein
MNQAGK